MLNKGSADKWNSQRAVMPTSLSSSSPYNCLSMSQQVSPEVAAAPLSGPAFYKRLGGKEVGFILRVSSESHLVEMFFFWRGGGFRLRSVNRKFTVKLSENDFGKQLDCRSLQIEILDVDFSWTLTPFGHLC